MKQLRKLPVRIVDALDTWIDLVETQSLEAARRIPGYHDELLRGNRQGQRSIRLSLAYRAIYEIRDDENGSRAVEFAEVQEVNKHDY